MLIFKGLPGTADPFVKIGDYNCKTNRILKMANAWSQANNKSVTINAIDNGTHGINGTVFTFHGLSLAWDFGVVNGVKADFESLGKYLQMRLYAPFQIIIESTHVHVEWDTGKGR